MGGEVVQFPGEHPVCREERDERLRLAGEVAELRADIGDPPDPTGTPDAREGSGIKGALVRIERAIGALTSKVDEACKRRSEPPPADTRVWGKRVGWVLLILALGAREARTIYAELTSAQAGQLPTTTQRVP